MAESEAGNTVDNNYTGASVPMLDTHSELEIPVLETTPGDEKKFTFFKHKMVSRFEIPRGAEDGTPLPPFQFKNHICRIPNELVKEFIKDVQGLHQSDSLNIVQLKNISNESPVLQAKSATSRGPTQTSDLSTSQMPGGATAPGKAPGLTLGRLRPLNSLGSRVVDTTEKSAT